MEQDKDLEILTMKKMLDIKRKISKADKPKEISSRDIVLSMLVDRGIEVLEIAEKHYPDKTKYVIDKLAELIKNGKVEYISGGELLGLFRQLGLNIHVETSINVEKHGKLVPLADKLKSDS
ncbi:MAG TPA: hypothetical protein VIH27_01850 [Nitrososphaerales archaeon]